MIWKIDRTRLITPALIVSFVLLWHFYVTWFGVSKFIIPPPLEVWDALVDLLTTPSTLRHTWATLYETIVGFVFASVVGVALGTVLGKTPWLERAINPFIVATQVVPKVALVPLFILWFGFGPESKVVVAAVLAFFPTLTNTVLGVKSVDSGHRDVMTVLNRAAKLFACGAGRHGGRDRSVNHWGRGRRISRRCDWAWLPPRGIDEQLQSRHAVRCDSFAHGDRLRSLSIYRWSAAVGDTVARVGGNQ